jgi:O-antigen ligase
VAVAIWAAMFALASTAIGKPILLALPIASALLWWLLGRTDRWMKAFFASAILLPPLPFAFGDSGPHIAPLFALVGLLVLFVSSPKSSPRVYRLLLLFLFFLVALLQSLLSAALYSGSQVALLSLARIMLFAIAPLVFFYTATQTVAGAMASMRFTRFLFRLATIAALFACADFYFQFPSPAGYSAQFVWLDNAVLRRAQGLFYEASTLGNFCVFFLVLVLVSFSFQRQRRPCSRFELVGGGLALGAALILSYSRGSLLNLLCAGATLLCIRRSVDRRSIFTVITSVLVIGTVIYSVFPDFAQSYWLRLQASVLYLPSAPGAILSGRLSSWSNLLHFLIHNPWHLLFGVGYKTLPYSTYVGSVIVTDNTYLDLLVETGLLGLSTFVALNVEILRSGFRAVHSPSAETRFFGTWFFCFWIGELVQMLSGDLITYWRVLPLYFWALAIAVRSPKSSGLMALH